MSQPPAEQPPRHPGYGPNPPGAAPGPAYPAAAGQPFPPAPGQQSYQPAPGPGPRPARDTLGLASLILGAVPSVIGLLFLLVQAAVITSGDPGVFGAISATSSVLSGLLGATALIVGLVAISRRGGSRTLAAAGIALGAATLVNVFGGLLYTTVISLMYR